MSDCPGCPHSSECVNASRTRPTCFKPKPRFMIIRDWPEYQDADPIDRIPLGFVDYRPGSSSTDDVPKSDYYSRAFGECPDIPTAEVL